MTKKFGALKLTSGVEGLALLKTPKIQSVHDAGASRSLTGVQNKTEKDEAVRAAPRIEDPSKDEECQKCSTRAHEDFTRSARARRAARIRNKRT